MRIGVFPRARTGAKAISVGPIRAPLAWMASSAAGLWRHQIGTARGINVTNLWTGKGWVYLAVVGL